MNIKRTVSANGLGRIEFRTQDDEDIQWRTAITPKDGCRLEFIAIDGLNFAIEQVRESAAPTEEKIDTAALNEDDARTLAAQRGIKMARSATHLEVVNALLRQEGRLKK